MGLAGTDGILREGRGVRAIRPWCNSPNARNCAPACISGEPKGSRPLVVRRSERRAASRRPGRFDVQRPPPPPAASPATASLPRGAGRGRRAVLHPGRVEGRAPPAIVVLRQLQVEPLAMHARGDVADARPRIEPGAVPRVRGRTRRRAAGEADGRSWDVPPESTPIEAWRGARFSARERKRATRGPGGPEPLDTWCYLLVRRRVTWVPPLNMPVI